MRHLLSVLSFFAFLAAATYIGYRMMDWWDRR